MIFGVLCYLYLGFFGEKDDDGGFVVRNSMTMLIIILWIVYFNYRRFKRGNFRLCDYYVFLRAGKS